MIDLYYWTTPNGHKVTMFLEEANLEYVDEFKPEIFEFELNAWYSDPGLWPEARSVEFIDRWVRIDLHSMLIDLERSRLKKREA